MTKTLSRLSASTAMGLLIAGGLAPHAFAQDSGNQTSVLSTIDVNAYPVGAAPSGTTDTNTVDAKEIEQKQAQTVAEAISDLPGVSVARADNLVTSNISIRNYGGNAAMPADPRVAFVLDGVSTAGSNLYRTATGQIVDPALLKSVSVVQGPFASLQYGSGLVGGTVVMDTINGSDLTGGQNGVKVRQLVGANSNGEGWKTSITLAWQVNDSFDILANYSRSYSDNQKDGEGNKINLGGYNVPSYLLKARYRFGEDKSQSLSFSYDRSEAVQQNVPFAQLSDISAFGNVNRERTGHVATVSYAWQPTDNPLIDLEVQYSQSRQHIDIVGLPGGFGSYFAGNYDLDTDTLQATNTAHFQTGSIGHTLKGGVVIAHQDHDGVMSGVAGAGKYNRQGVFATDDMDFGHALTVSAGARIEHQSLYDLISSSNAALPDMSAVAHSAGLGFEQGLGYGFKGYGSFAYGEGLGLIDYAGSNPARDPGYFGDKVFKSRTWETGVKYEGEGLFDGGDRLTASLGLFKTDIWNDNTQPVSSYAAYYDSLSNSGLQAQATYQMANGLYARAAATTTFNDKKRAGSANWVYYEYALMDQGSLTLGKKWDNGFEASWSLRGGAGQTLGPVHQAGFGVTDLAASYTFQSGTLEGLNVIFGVDNVFDKQYTLNYGTTASSVTYPEAGRNFKLTLAKTF